MTELTSEQKSYLVMSRLIHIIETQHEITKGTYDMLNRILIAPDDFDYRPHVTKAVDNIQRVIDDMAAIIAGLKEAMSDA